MPVLQPNIIPTLGLPTQIVARPRPKKSLMSKPDFYEAPVEDPKQKALQEQTMQAIDSEYRPQDLGFASDPVSGDYIKAQLASYQNRQAVPSLQPGGRVKPVNSSIADPSNFEGYYARLGMTEDLGKTMLSTATAKRQFAEQQRLMNVLNQGVQSPGSVNLKGGSGGQAFGSGIPSNPAANFQFAQQIGPQFGWTGNELSAWYTLGMKESGWRNTAQNPTSTAYGIGQFLNSTWASVGIPKTSDPYQQVLAMAKYIQQRYGSPSRALAFHLSHNWY